MALGAAVVRVVREVNDEHADAVDVEVVARRARLSVADPILAVRRRCPREGAGARQRTLEEMKILPDRAALATVEVVG